MDRLTLFGLIAVTLMLVFYTLERRSTWFILGFAAACVLASAYGFLQGAWPFGIVEAIWSGVAFRRWWLERHRAGNQQQDFVNNCGTAVGSCQQS
jgi:hypothetical protein